MRIIDFTPADSNSGILFNLRKAFYAWGSKVNEKNEVTRKGILKPILLSIFGVVIVSGLAIAGYIYHQLQQISSVQMNKSPKALGILPAVEARVDTLKDTPVNIALFGLDKRPGDRYGNSDAIILVSISTATNKIKLSSIMRDTYVKIDSIGMGKVNAAYRVGGPQLAVKTLNQNFSLNIENFVSVDFNGLAHVIDALNGLTLDVKKEELRWVNSYLDENNKDSRVKPPYLSKPGLQTLNGPQAVAYTRVRQVGTDTERTQRQRTVLSLILKKLKSAGASEFPNIVSKVLPYVNTSIPSFQLLTLGATVFTNNMRTVEERRFPLHTESKGQMIDGSWYLVADLKATSKSIFDFMFEGSN